MQMRGVYLLLEGRKEGKEVPTAHPVLDWAPREWSPSESSGRGTRDILSQHWTQAMWDITESLSSLLHLESIECREVQALKNAFIPSDFFNFFSS